MHRHVSVGILRPRPAGRRGFTLVELLVVIAVIAMLVGLLVPAVLRAREAGRRATCLNNQQQLGKAVTQYVTSKNRFPPLFATQPLSTVTPPLRVGYVPNLLPFLEQNPLYQIFQTNGWLTTPSAEVDVLICPSRNPTFSPAPLSYCVNAGMQDRPGSTANQLDAMQNGIFFDEYAPNPAIRGLLNLPSLRPTPPTDMSYVSSRDGISTTLLLSENVDCRDWINLGTTTTEQGYPLQPTYIATYYDPAPANLQAGSTWWQGMVWSVVNTPLDFGTAGRFPTGQLLNKNTDSPTKLDIDFTTTFSTARPSSNHSGGFNATFVDGHSSFIDENIEYRVYCLLMAPDNADARLPQTGANLAYPNGWRNNSDPNLPLRPVTSADFE